MLAVNVILAAVAVLSLLFGAYQWSKLQRQRHETESKQQREKHEAEERARDERIEADKLESAKILATITAELKALAERQNAFDERQNRLEGRLDDVIKGWRS